MTTKASQLKAATPAQAVAVVEAAKPPAYQPSAAVAKLLAERGIAVHPPGTKAGTHDVEWTGKKFVLPAEPGAMSLADAGKMLLEKAAEENHVIYVSEVVDTLPLDGAQAFAKAVEDLFGFGITKDRTVQGFFGPTKAPPVLRTVQTGPGPSDTLQVFWGALYIPQMGVELQCGVGAKDERRVFVVEGEIPRGKRHVLDTLMALTRIYASERSIYKGKAIRMFTDDDGLLNWQKDPEFIASNPYLADELVFSADVEEQIETSLFTPIKYAQACRDMGVPLKRGILFEGPYGVGKSMTAAATADIAPRYGWTFITIDRVAALRQILDFAHRYAPVVIFVEDIDRVMKGEDRTVQIDDVLNTLDGIHSKDREIITVFTTNHVEKINQAMLRPGRFDHIVSLRAPDAEAAEKLARLYSRGLITANDPLKKSREMLAGKIPAVIREVVERAKLAAIRREKGSPSSLADDDLIIAAKSMDAQLALLAPKTPPEFTPEHQLGAALRENVDASLKQALANGAIKKISDKVDDIHDAVA